MSLIPALWKALQPDLTRRPRLLKLLSLFDRAAAFLRRRPSGDRRALDDSLGEFHDRIWREAAAHLGATVEPLGGGVLEIRLGKRRTRTCRHVTGMDDLITHQIARTKPIIYSLLEQHGLPTPRHLLFPADDMQPAAAFLEESTRPCVIKPASGTSGGRGVATGIQTRWQLARAAYSAARFDDSLLIEEQVDGDNYRLLYLDGKLLDAVLRRPPTVVADGSSSVGELVRQANADRSRHGTKLAHDLLTIDMDMKRTLARQGYSLRSVPREGTVVTVKTAINENGGSDNIRATDLLCPEIIAAGACAARAAGVRLAGVDIIATDPTVPLAEGGGVILEVNSPPGYYWHYCRRGSPFPLAIAVLRCLLEAPATEPCLPLTEAAPTVAQGENF